MVPMGSLDRKGINSGCSQSHERNFLRGNNAILQKKLSIGCGLLRGLAFVPWDLEFHVGDDLAALQFV